MTTRNWETLFDQEDVEYMSLRSTRELQVGRPTNLKAVLGESREVMVMQKCKRYAEKEDYLLLV